MDWDTILNGNSNPNINLNSFYDMVNKTIEEKINLKKNKSLKFPVWFSQKTIKLYEQKRKIFNKYKIYNRIVDHNLFRKIRKKLKESIIENYKLYVYEMEKNIKSNVKNFFSFVKSKRANKNNYPSKMILNEESAEDNISIANLFADFFESSYIESDINYSNIYENNSTNTYESKTNILLLNEEDIFKCINGSKDILSFGPDGIPAYFIKRCAISPLLSNFNYF